MIRNATELTELLYDKIAYLPKSKRDEIIAELQNFSDGAALPKLVVTKESQKELSY